VRIAALTRRNFPWPADFSRLPSCERVEILDSLLASLLVREILPARESRVTCRDRYEMLSADDRLSSYEWAEAVEVRQFVSGEMFDIVSEEGAS